MFSVFRTIFQKFSHIVFEVKPGTIAQMVLVRATEKFPKHILVLTFEASLINWDWFCVVIYMPLSEMQKLFFFELPIGTWYMNKWIGNLIFIWLFLHKINQMNLHVEENIEGSFHLITENQYYNMIMNSQIDPFSLQKLLQ